MRRIPASLLLLLMLLPLSAVAAQSPDATPTTESAQLRAAAQKLLATGSPDDTVKAADLLDKASAIDARNSETLKTDLDRRKLEEKGPAWKSFVSDFGPLITVLVLAGTFIFNIIQARITEREKRQDDELQRKDKLDDLARQEKTDDLKRAADEQKRYTDAMALIQKAEDFSPTAALIRTFTTEPYRSEARQMGMDIMLKTKSYDRFQDLFRTVAEPITYDNLPQIVTLLRSVHTAVSPLLSKTWINGTNDLTKLTPDQVDSYNLLVNERMFLGARIATALRQPRDISIPLDLSGVGLDGCDFTGVDLRNASIGATTWNYVNFDGADLRNITDFKNCWFYSTAWWHAAHIDKPMLQYLKDNFPFATVQYSNSPQPISPDDYTQNLARLEAIAE